LAVEAYLLKWVEFWIEVRIRNNCAVRDTKFIGWSYLMSVDWLFVSLERYVCVGWCERYAYAFSLGRAAGMRKRCAEIDATGM